MFSSASPVGVLLGVVAPEAQVKVLAHVTVDPAAHDQALAVVARVLHVHHLVGVLVALWLGPTWVEQGSRQEDTGVSTQETGRGNLMCVCVRACCLTEEAGLAQVHVHALQAAVAVPGRHPLTAVAGDDHVEEVAVARDEHVHLWTPRG